MPFDSSGQASLLRSLSMTNICVNLRRIGANLRSHFHRYRRGLARRGTVLKIDITQRRQGEKGKRSKESLTAFAPLREILRHFEGAKRPRNPLADEKIPPPFGRRNDVTRDFRSLCGELSLMATVSSVTFLPRPLSNYQALSDNASSVFAFSQSHK